MIKTYQFYDKKQKNQNKKKIPKKYMKALITFFTNSPHLPAM